MPSLPTYILTSILTTASAMASTSAPSSLPQVDYSKLGNVLLGGSFSGLDWYPSTNTASTSSSSSTKFSTDGDTVFLRSSDGSYTPLGATNTGGKVSSLCWSNSSVTSTDTSSNGTLYIGGSFTSISSVSSSNIIAYSLTSSTFHTLSTGLSGSVNTLYCDNSHNQIWVGGSFNAPIGSGGNVALWSTSSSSWISPSFGGLNAAVKDISPSIDGNSLYFSGGFSTTYLSNSSTLQNSSISTNSTSNYTSIQSAPSNTSTVGISGYLTPVTLPASSSSSGDLRITTGPSTKQAGYSDSSVLLCPGSGAWLGQDNTEIQVEIEGYSYWMATGARIANTEIQGRGTTAFCITSLPDNTQLTMTYKDPVTGANMTCSEHCPLSVDPTIAAQDFLFQGGSRNLTGLQLQLKEWQGAGVGLSSIQLLSDGAYGSAVGSNNKGTCSSSKSSSSSINTGTWTEKQITTSIPATVSTVLVSTVSTTNPTYPSVIFYPYVSSTAYYDVYIVIPGCTQLGDCSGRTSVDIEVFPTQGGLGWTSTISEQVTEDTRTLVYSGIIQSSSDSFTPTISLALAASPAKPASGDEYVIIADAVQLVLTGLAGSSNSSSSGGSSNSSSGGSTNGSSTTNSTRISNSTSKISFGVFEYLRSSTSNLNAASSSLSNVSETSLTKLGYSLETALNTSGFPSWTVNTVTALGSTIYVGGNFSVSGNYSNVVGIDTSSGGVVSLPSGGLNGAVYASATIGNYIYFGGGFTSTSTSGTSLSFLARYDPSGKSWTSLAGGVNGPVTSLSTSSNQLIITGNFSQAISSYGSTSSTGGYAIYDTSSSTFTSSGVVFGNLTSSVSTDKGVYLAGKVLGTSSNAVNGVAVLTANSDGVAQISSLSGVNLGQASVSSSSSLSSTTRRSHLQGRGTTYSSHLFNRFTDIISSVITTPLISRATSAPTITSQISSAPAVLAVGYYTNSSTSYTILGGNFTETSNGSSVSGLGFYSSGNKLGGPVPGVGGVVKALQVVGDSVYLGGSGVTVSGVGSGLVVYNLAQGKWITGNMAALSATSGSNVTINAIKSRTNTNTLVVAGTFSSAGSLTCPGVCLWDSESSQWSAPGSGLSSGEVRVIDFAGDSSDTLVAGGSFVGPSGNVAYVALYSFTNSTWTEIGPSTSLPGPTTALAVDNKNVTNVFAAGYSTSDSTPYLSQWDGDKWTLQPNSSQLQVGSTITQLAFVPMLSGRTVTGSIEGDRMLLVSGNLIIGSQGNVTSALYDGTQFYPYLIGTTASGTPSSGSQLFWSQSSFSFNIYKHLATGLVVLVAIAIATGLILLLILLFFLIAYCTRRRERKDGKDKSGNGAMFEKEGSEVSSTHQHVFHNVQAALEQSLGNRTSLLAGGGLVGAGVGAGLAGTYNSRHLNRGSGESEYPDAAATAAAADGGSEYSSENDEDEGRETTMRYEFGGPDLQTGEMSMKAGARILILDDEQSHEWWYARDPATGREGVVPATYVW